MKFSFDYRIIKDGNGIFLCLVFETPEGKKIANMTEITEEEASETKMPVDDISKYQIDGGALIITLPERKEKQNEIDHPPDPA